MSDFSELCPLFETGVFHEFTFPEISLTAISADANAIMFSIDEQASSSANFNFGRTVKVTQAWLRMRSAGAGAGIIHLRHCASNLAAGTIIGTMSATTTVTGHGSLAWVPFTMVSATFDSAAVLGLNLATATSDPGALFDLMIRYKEK
jgi:hypothetical protein